ncbi:MAG: hypothetical protein R2753_14300 [Chitinophagales bacterium]
MASRKSLNGLANNITQSYLSTLNYQCRGLTHCGYGVDWIFAGLKATNAKRVTIDILSYEITPTEMQIPQLTGHLSKIQSIITDLLEPNDFNINDISSAVIICELVDPESNNKFVKVRTEIKLTDGWNIPNKEYKEIVYKDLDFFPLSLIEKLKRKATR